MADISWHVTQMSNVRPVDESLLVGPTLVTGAGAGIGLAVARLLSRSGNAVALLDRDSDRVGVAASELRVNGGGVALALSCDVSDEAELDSAFDEAERELGPWRVSWPQPGSIEAASCTTFPQKPGTRSSREPPGDVPDLPRRGAQDARPRRLDRVRVLPFCLCRSARRGGSLRRVEGWHLVPRPRARRRLRSPRNPGQCGAPWTDGDRTDVGWGGVRARRGDAARRSARRSRWVVWPIPRSLPGRSSGCSRKRRRT